MIRYDEVTAQQLLNWIDKDHPVGGKGNCLCPECEAYGWICYIAAKVGREKA